jgi:hypothetical protein
MLAVPKSSQSIKINLRYLVIDKSDDAHHLPKTESDLRQAVNFDKLFMAGVEEQGVNFVHVDIGAGLGRTLDEVATQVSCLEG